MTSYLLSLISYLKPQTSNLKPQTSNLRRHQGQVDGEGAALADGGGDADRAAVLRDDLAGDEQAQAQALAGRAHGLGRLVEAVEQGVHLVGRDAGPVVLHVDGGLI